MTPLLLWLRSWRGSSVDRINFFVKARPSLLLSALTSCVGPSLHLNDGCFRRKRKSTRTAYQCRFMS